MKQFLSGGLAGFIATSPMTTLMVFLFLRLPLRERFTWPPYTITMEASKGIGLRRRQGPLERLQLAMAAHFGFGAVAGGLYGLVAERIPLPSVLAGSLYGLVVWTTSYLGWLPLVNLYQRPQHMSPRRQALMATAHLVWGAVLALLFEQLAGETMAGETMAGETTEKKHNRSQ